MIILPAIDIKDKKVVRLRQGRFDLVTVYSADPIATAQKWVNCGAQWIHIVDLDGAQSGEMKNFDLIAEIIKNVKVAVEVGGGIRSENDIERLIKTGVQRVVVATRVIEDHNFLAYILKKWPNKIAVSVDCVNGLVTQKGWTSVTEIKGTDFVKTLEKQGLQYLIYTDIKRDGMLQGPNLEALKEILNTTKVSVIASGGISNIEDIKNLLAIKAKNLFGVITGKAIYEETLDLEQAIKICLPNE